MFDILVSISFLVYSSMIRSGLRIKLEGIKKLPLRIGLHKRITNTSLFWKIERMLVKIIISYTQRFDILV